MMGCTSHFISYCLLVIGIYVMVTCATSPGNRLPIKAANQQQHIEDHRHKLVGLRLNLLKSAGVTKASRAAVNDAVPPTPTSAIDFVKGLLQDKETVAKLIPLLNVLKGLVDTSWLGNPDLLTVLNGVATFVFGDLPTVIEGKLFHGTVGAILGAFGKVNFTGLESADTGRLITSVLMQLPFSDIVKTYYSLLGIPAKPSLSFQLESALLNFTMITLPQIVRNPVVQDTVDMVMREIKSVNFTGVNHNQISQIILAIDSQVNWDRLRGNIYADLYKHNMFTDPSAFSSVLTSIILNTTLGTIPKTVANPLTLKIYKIIMEDLSHVNLSVVDPQNIIKSIKGVVGQLHPAAVLTRISALPEMRNVSRDIPAVSPKCAADTSFFISSLFSTKSWALRMVDALGKPTAGLLKGNLYELGNYDECLSSTAYLEMGEKKVERFKGEFCRITVNLPKSVLEGLNVDTHGFPARVSWGLCVPDSCNETDLRTVLTTGLLSKLSLDVEEVFCGSNPQLKDDPSASAAIGVLAFIISLVAAGTLVDIIYSTKYKQDLSQETKIGLTNGAVGSNRVTTGEKDYKKLLELKPVLEKDCAIYPEIDCEEMNKNTTHEQRDTLVVKVWTCFSVVSNVPKILAATHSKNSVRCVNGIRYFSMLWIILCNTFYFGVSPIADNATSGNTLDAASYLQKFTFMPILYGTFSLDTFFLISGFLAAYIFFRDLDQHNGVITCKKMVKFYVHRLWRLTPMYMIVLMGFSCLYQYLGTGPLFPRNIADADYCKANWWTNLLYISNLVNDKQMCMSWSFYLSLDMQFFIISPIFILALYFFPVIGILLTLLLVATSITSTAIIQYKGAGDILSAQQPPVPGKPSYYQDIFIKPWCRVSAYAIGLLLAKLIHHRGQSKTNWIVAIIGWLDALVIGLFLVYVGYTQRQEDAPAWSLEIHAVYESLSRPAFAAAVAWVVFACHSGVGGVVNSILSFKGFIPLARLTFAAYLIHPILIVVFVYTRKSLVYIDDYTMGYLFIGHQCLAYAGALLLSVAFEVPFLNLEKLTLKTLGK